jgi:hypothetical protein
MVSEAGGQSFTPFSKLNVRLWLTADMVVSLI